MLADEEVQAMTEGAPSTVYFGSKQLGRTVHERGRPRLVVPSRHTSTPSWHARTALRSALKLWL